MPKALQGRACKDCRTPLEPGCRWLRCEECADDNRRARQRHRLWNLRANPEFREIERRALRKRMRKLRTSPGYLRPDRPAAKRLAAAATATEQIPPA
jgi:hypothetical protein